MPVELNDAPVERIGSLEDFPKTFAERTNCIIEPFFQTYDKKLKDERLFIPHPSSFIPQNVLVLRRSVFREIFVAVGVVDGFFRVGRSKPFGGGLSVSVIGRSRDNREMAHFVNERAGF